MASVVLIHSTTSTSPCPTLGLLPRRPRAAHRLRPRAGRGVPRVGTDMVIPVPSSGFYAALGFARASGLEFQQGLIRWHTTAAAASSSRRRRSATSP
ncbi:hypothetical protein ACP4OV_001318 [Aristida adscensionis]